MEKFQLDSITGKKYNVKSFACDVVNTFFDVNINRNNAKQEGDTKRMASK